ncbi:sigma-54-dependent Fis family transcriptional regulator [bacterium SCSIO 12696]|nr:sigma-54-dependent Fis family transcriptional regulator [bacterium SCSIO 12696]
MSDSTTKGRALIVDDEPDIRELLCYTLQKLELDVAEAGDIASAISLLNTDNFTFCLTDMRLPDGDGLSLVEHIQKHCPQMPVAVITAHGNMEIAVDALKKGAFDFVSKPVDLARLRAIVRSALELSESSPGSQTSIPGLLGHSAAMEKLRSQIGRVSRTQAPVFISGESGSGKELVARSIHYLSPRTNGPFIPVNCGAIPSELMESEFFGHKKGSFTGAHKDKQGLFQAAEGGTLFLDEVADLPLSMQVKLLRAIQEKAVRPVGEEREIDTDIRILSATHKDLEAEVEDGRFRQDLYYRINVIELPVPSLRLRRDDIPELAEAILQRLAKESGLQAEISENALNALKQYHFPGNVREMENILERAMTLCDNDQIHANDLQLKSGNGEREATAGEPIDQHFVDNLDSVDEYLESIERQILEVAIQKHKGNRTAAARDLGLTLRQIRYKIQKLGMEME